MNKKPRSQGLHFFLRCAAVAGVVLVLGFALSCAQPTVGDQNPKSAAATETESKPEEKMSITRINQFTANPGSGDELYELIDSFMPLIRSSDGCIDAQLQRGVDDPDKIVVIEVWRDKEAHKASAKNVPPGTFEKAMELMSGPPSGEYYN